MGQKRGSRRRRRRRVEEKLGSTRLRPPARFPPQFCEAFVLSAQPTSYISLCTIHNDNSILRFSSLLYSHALFLPSFLPSFRLHYTRGAARTQLDDGPHELTMMTKVCARRYKYRTVPYLTSAGTSARSLVRSLFR